MISTTEAVLNKRQSGDTPRINGSSVIQCAAKTVTQLHHMEPLREKVDVS